MGIFLAEDGQFLENTIYFLSLNVIMSHYSGTCCLDSVACASPLASSLSHTNAWPLMVVCSWDILVSSSPFPTPPSLSLSLNHHLSSLLTYNFTSSWWWSIKASSYVLVSLWKKKDQIFNNRVSSFRTMAKWYLYNFTSQHAHIFLWRVWTFVLLVRFYLKQVSYTSVLEYGRNHISPKV